MSSTTSHTLWSDLNFTDTDCLLHSSTQTCLVLEPGTLPGYAISVAAIHFAAGGLALLCAIGFILNVTLSKQVMLAMGSKQPTDKISFFVAPLLCCIFCFCSLVHGLSTFPVQSSDTYTAKHIGCECLASVGLQHTQYILHSFVVPLILIVAFEQSYVIHKRKTAKFCCIGFDRGHRLKAKNFQVQVLSMVLRSSMWFIAGGLAIFNVVMNAMIVMGSQLDLRKQQRFTYKSLIENPQAGDLVEFIFMSIFTLYFGFSLWNYGKNYSMKMTAMPCTIWMMMLVGSFGMVVSNLLPSWISPFTANISMVLYLMTVILLEKEVLEDMSRLMEWKDGKAEPNETPTSRKSHYHTDLPKWAQTKMFMHFQEDATRQLEEQEERKTKTATEVPTNGSGVRSDEKVVEMMSNPLSRMKMTKKKKGEDETEEKNKEVGQGKEEMQKEREQEVVAEADVKIDLRAEL